MRRATRQGLAVVVALLLQIPAWRAITTDASALVVAGLAIVGVGLAGVVLRALRALQVLKGLKVFRVLPGQTEPTVRTL